MNMNKDYRLILKEIFEERSFLNATYSLRAFARDLNVSPSTLSEILNRKKGLSLKLAMSVANKLKMPSWEKEYFCDLVSKENSKSSRIRNDAIKRLKDRSRENDLKILNHKAIRALTSWTDLAILELTNLKQFENSITWIAKQLNIEESSAKLSVERLIEAKLLKIDKVSGKWSDISPLFSTTDGVPSESIRRLHKTILFLALQKLESVDNESRSVKSIVFSLSNSQIPKAKKIIDNAIGEIVALADKKNHERDQVMCFSSQLFSLLTK